MVFIIYRKGLTLMTTKQQTIISWILCIILSISLIYSVHQQTKVYESMKEYMDYKTATTTQTILDYLDETQDL